MWPNNLVIYRLFLFLSVTLLISCGGGSEPGTEPGLTGIEFSNTQTELSSSTTSQLTIIAIFDDGSSKNITSETTWETSDADVATVDNTGLLTTYQYTDDISITASYQSYQATLALSINPGSNAALDTLSFLPGTNAGTLAASDTILVSASYADSTVDAQMEFVIDSIRIDTSGNTVFELSNNGTSFQIIIADTAAENISVILTPPATLDSITISTSTINLLSGETLTVSALARYSDDTAFDVTDSVNWISNNEASLAVVAETPSFLAKNTAGVASISASAEGVDSNAIQITISEPDITPPLPVVIDPILEYIEIAASKLLLSPTETSTLTVTAYYNSGPAKDLTSEVIWTTNNDNFTLFDNMAQASSNTGSTEITASIDNKTDSITLDIKTLDNMQLTVGINLSKAHVEDNSEPRPLIQAFQNPVGLLDNIIFPTPYPGFHITLENTINNEQLVLAIGSPAIGDFDKTQSSAIYRMPSGEYYRLDGSDSTNTINISLDTLGALGETSQGGFSAVLCKASVLTSLGDCSLESNQLSISGAFLVTTENDKTYQSFAVDNPKVLDEYVAENLQQISTESSHYRLLTAVGSNYKVRAFSNDAAVSFSVSSSHNGNNSTENSTVNPEDNTEQSVTFTAESATSDIVFSFAGDGSGTTFGIDHSALAPTAQGNEMIPLTINTGSVFFNKPGQVDNTTSYYNVIVKPGYAYRISIEKDSTEPESQAISGLSYKTNTDDDYTTCVGSNGNFSCVINTENSSSIFLKVDGAEGEDSFSNFQITTEYNPVRDPEDFQEALSIPVEELVNLTGQVGYGTPASLNGDNFGSRASVYWVTNLKPDTYYKIRLSELQDGTRFWVNEPMNFTSLCDAAGNAISSDVYCIIRTGIFSRGLALYIDNSVLSIGTIGTTYTLNMSEVSADDLYYFSTFGNGSSEGCPQNCERIGYTMYSGDDTVPFASSITSDNPLHKKLLHINSGDSIYIRISAKRRIADAYSIHIGASYINSTLHRVENPDIYEANNDDIKENATRLSLEMASNHSLSYNDGNFDDVDWFVFTARSDLP